MPQTEQVFVHTYASKKNHENSCCIFSSKRVAPESTGIFPGYHILEIRPGRIVRVRHVNPTARDPDFDKQKQKSIALRQEDSPIKLPHHLRLQRQKTKQHGDLSNKQGFRNHQSSIDAEHSNLPNSCDKDENSNDNHNESQVDNGDISHSRNILRSRATTASSVNFHMPQKTSSVSKTLKSLPAMPSKQNDALSKNIDKDRYTVGNYKTLLFFIHGVGGSSDVWQAQLDYFEKEGYEMIVPDLLGHGFSATPSDPKAYEFSEISEDLLVLFDKFCKPRNVVIGHSYGCSFAAVLGRRRQRYVSKLVLVSGGSPTPLAPQPGLFQTPVCCLVCCRPAMERGFSKSAFHKNNKTYIPREKAFDIPTYVLKAVMNGQNWDEGDAEYHGWINAPTLLIHGRQDQLVSIEEEQEMVEAIFDSKLVILDDASHMVMLEKPQEVNQLIHDFLLTNMGLIGSAAESNQKEAQRVSMTTTCFNQKQAFSDDQSSLSLKSVVTTSSTPEIIA